MTDKENNRIAQMEQAGIKVACERYLRLDSDEYLTIEDFTIINKKCEKEVKKLKLDILDLYRKAEVLMKGTGFDVNCTLEQATTYLYNLLSNIELASTYLFLTILFISKIISSREEENNG